jgi:drug/metabolite transporter (DMT)-like permease
VNTTSPSILSPKVLIPFVIVTLIWSTTWIVIRGQLGMVPPSWSVTYRFLVSGIVMLGWAKASGASLKLGREGQLFAILFGIAQFTFNFNFVYRAEAHITSGLVAVVFALLLVPNAILSRIFLRQRMTGRFIVGSIIAIAGLALLFLQEARAHPGGQAETLWGVGLTLAGVMSASTANVMQASARARAMPMASLLGWGMLWGTTVNAVLAWALTGPPVVDMRPSYLIGVAYLGVMASAIAFTLYFGLIRVIGPARAAYSSVIIPIIAMLISTFAEDYRWSALAVAGCALALSGLVIALTARKPST